MILGGAGFTGCIPSSGTVTNGALILSGFENIGFQAGCTGWNLSSIQSIGSRDNGISASGAQATLSAILVDTCQYDGIYSAGSGQTISGTFIRNPGSVGSNLSLAGINFDETNGNVESHNTILDDRGASACMAYGVKETGSGALNEIHTQSTGHTNAPILLVAGSTSAVFVKGTTTQPYSSSITPDIATGLQKGITVTDGSAFTVNAPMQLFPGAAITFHFFNNSGGPMGAITWASLYQLTGNNGTFVGPPDGSRSTISFYYDGANLIETDRTSAIIGASPYPYTRELTTSGLTALIENLPRRQINLATIALPANSAGTGTLQVYSMDLGATVTLSKIAFLAGTTALACCLTSNPPGSLIRCLN